MLLMTKNMDCGSMVMETNDGVLAVDYGRGFGALLAAQAPLNKRLAKIEKKRA